MAAAPGRRQEDGLSYLMGPYVNDNHQKQTTKKGLGGFDSEVRAFAWQVAGSISLAAGAHTHTHTP